MKTEEIERKKEEKLDTSNSNHETGFLNVFRFIAFTILVTFKNFEAKLIMYRSSHLEVFSKIGVLRHLTKLTRKNLCRSVFFNKVARLLPVALLKKTLRHRCF